MTLRLGQLPDRTPVRLSLSVDPELASALSDYAEVPFFIRQTLDAYRLANPSQRGVY